MHGRSRRTTKTARRDEEEGNAKDSESEVYEEVMTRCASFLQDCVQRSGLELELEILRFTAQVY